MHKIAPAAVNASTKKGQEGAHMCKLHSHGVRDGEIAVAVVSNESVDVIKYRKTLSTDQHGPRDMA
jgi:hypothetical protein